MNLLSSIPLFKRHANQAKGSIQSRIDPFTLFACQTADNCDKSYSQKPVHVDPCHHNLKILSHTCTCTSAENLYSVASLSFSVSLKLQFLYCLLDISISVIPHTYSWNKIDHNVRKATWLEICHRHVIQNYQGNARIFFRKP